VSAHHIHHSGWEQKQVNSLGLMRWNGEAAMLPAIVTGS
jgi:hypothetical protein